MIRRIFAMGLVASLAAVFFYLSRFWSFSLWSHPGLFGWEELRPQGALVHQWLRGTDFAPFELLIWAVGCFVVLTWVQKLYDLITPVPDTGEDDG